MLDAMHIFLWFIFYSFAGWVYETLLALIVHKKFIWKNFLQGPFCPVYGLGAVAVVLCLSPLKGQIIPLFLLGALITCSVEYATAWFLETFFKHKEWNYSPRRWNLHGRVCALGAVVFGAFSVLLIEYLHPIVSAFTHKFPQNGLIFYFISFSVLFAIDFSITFYKLLINSRTSHIHLEKNKL